MNALRGQGHAVMTVVVEEGSTGYRAVVLVVCLTRKLAADTWAPSSTVSKSAALTVLKV